MGLDENMEQALPALFRPEGEEPDDPLVSVVVCTYNCVDYVEEALQSALAQDYAPLEVVVVDDHSEDGTWECIKAISDPRVRAYRNRARLGQSRNRNRAVELSRGSFVKFLDGDDYLMPGCVTKMLDAIGRDSAVGFVFCTRQIVGQDSEESVSDWSVEFGSLHDRIPGLSDQIDGRVLLREWIKAGLQRNWIGEPTAVMARRAHLSRAAGFREYVRLFPDIELWARLMATALVGFVDEPLVAYRRGHDSETLRNGRTGTGWLGRLWILESLYTQPEIREYYPEVAELLRGDRRSAWRTVVKCGRGAGGLRVPVRPYFRYLRYRISQILQGRER